jgi:pimeloyl-ACP methyl ester carboxylesterase
VRFLAGIARAALSALLMMVIVGVLDVVVAAADTRSSAVSVQGRVTHVDLAFRSGDVTLHGTLVAPADRPRGVRRPGLVLVHGAGAGTLRERLLPAAEAFAAQGLVTFVYDKRSAGYTTSHRDFLQLADDAVAAARLLRSRPEVDSAAVGLWGVSEGGWVLPIAAERAPDLAFLVLISANGISPAQQTAWAQREVTRRAGVTSHSQNTAGITVVRFLAGSGQFAQAGYDPVPALSRIRQPLLAIWGGQDNSTPPGDGVRVFRGVLTRSGHPSYTLRVFPQGNHGIGLAPGGIGEGEGDTFVPGYPELVGSWVKAIAAGQPPTPHADRVPPQPLPSPHLSPLAGWESPTAQLTAWALSATAITLYLLTGAAGWARRAAGRVRGRPAPDPPLPRSAGWLAVLSSTGLAGLGIYLIHLLGPQPAVGPILAGRSLEWLCLQLLALTTILLIIVSIFGAHRRRNESHRPTGGALARLAVLETGALSFVTLAVYWGLLQA